MSLIGEIVIVLMALTVGSHGVVNGDWVGMGLFVCVMSDSISDLVVGNRDWSGGDSGLLVRVVCEL